MSVPHDLVEVRRLVLGEAAQAQVVHDEHARCREAEEPLVAAVAARGPELDEQFVGAGVRNGAEPRAIT